MRRHFICALLLLFVTQSSGVALANAPGGTGTPVIVPSIASIVNPILSAIEGSQIFAEFTGNENRYAAMHAPAPRIVRSQTQIDTTALMRREHAVAPVPRIGVPDHVTMPPVSVLDAKHPMLDPLAMRRSNVTTSALQRQAQLPFAIEPLHSLTTTVKPRGIHPSGQRQKSGPNPMIAVATGAGIQPWWTYEERAIPGIGKAMLNVSTGNLVVSAVDVDVHEEGIDLAFQRVYNTQSLHDYNSDDGGDNAIYGNLWTNNFDANIVYDQNANTFTVYDIDGTACTYTSDGQGGWKPCPGVHATFAPTDYPNDCTYAWTKTNGTVYWFHADNSGGTGCSIPQAKKGRLQEILGRNHNNNITFTYYYTQRTPRCRTYH